MAWAMRYVIELPPVTKKNSQRIAVNKATGKRFILPSERYTGYEAGARWFLRPMPDKPLTGPLNVKCLFYMPTRRAVDLNNLLEAATDTLVRWRIIEDDNSRVVASHDGSRVRYDKDHPRTEIIITEAEP